MSDDFFKPKIVWTAVNSEYRFCKVSEAIFLNNSLFMITGEESLHNLLCSIFNSNLYQYYFNISLSSGSYAYGSRDYFAEVPVIKNVASDKIEILKRLIQKEQYQQINEVIFELYHLSAEEIDFINSSITTFILQVHF